VDAKELRVAKAFIFDLDQTLIDSLDRFYVAFNEALKRFSLKQINRELFEKLYKEDRLNELLGQVPKEAFWDYFLQIYDEVEAPPSKPIEGALELLKLLKSKGVKVAVVTGRKTPVERLASKLSELGLMKYVDVLLTAQHDGEICRGFLKVGLLERAMGMLGVKPKECVFVGDYKPDILTGKMLGVFTIGVLTGKESAEKLKELGADLVLGSVKGLLRMLKA